MAFKDRNKNHQLLRQQVREDAKKNNYFIQPYGHEKLNLPLSYRNNDDVSWFIRASPDDLCTTKRGSYLIEFKSKISTHPNIAIELKPLEIYKIHPQDIFVACETLVGGGLPSVKVKKAKYILIEYIIVPKRDDNDYNEIKSRYPSATVKKYGATNGGSNTPFVLIFPNFFDNWSSWDNFRTNAILNGNNISEINLDSTLDDWGIIHND